MKTVEITDVRNGENGRALCPRISRRHLGSAPRKARRNRHAGIVIAFVLCLMILGIQGCGGGYNFPTDEQKRRSQEEAEKREKEAAEKAPVTEKLKPIVDKEDAPPPAARRESNQLPPLPAPRDILSEWQEGDFHAARVSGDPRLPAAIELRSKRVTRDQDREAEAALLAVLVPPPKARSFAGGTGPGAVKPLVEAIATALAANGSPAARKTLEQMAVGAIASDDPKVAAEAAVKAMLGRPDAESEDVLFRILTAQPQRLPSAKDVALAEALRKQTLESAKSALTSRLRAMLAKVVVASSTLTEVRDGLLPVLKTVHPRNLEAHAILCRSDFLDAPTRSAIEKNLLQSSSQAIGMMLGVGQERRIADNDREWPYHVAQCLWSPAFAGFVESRRQATRSPGDAASLALLGCTMPTNAVRAKLRRYLTRQWEDGPGVLQSNGLGKGLVVDPGLLVVLKTALPRTSPTPAAAKRPANGKRPLSKAQENQLKTREEQEKIDEPWWKLAETLLRSQCEQFCAASLAREDAARQNGREPEAIDASLAQPSGPCFKAAPTASYFLDWPGELAEKLPGVPLDPMQVFYFRFEEKTRSSKVARYYRQSLKGCKERATDKAIWLDSLHAGSAPGRMRSVDVLISRPTGGSIQVSTEEQELTVEILSIEIGSLGDNDQIAGGQ